MNATETATETATDRVALLAELAKIDPQTPDHDRLNDLIDAAIEAGCEIAAIRQAMGLE